MKDTSAFFESLFFPFRARGKARIVPFALALLSLANLCIVFSKDPATFSYLSLISSIVFTAEYASRIYYIPHVRPEATSSAARAHYIFSFMGFIDFFSGIAPLLFFFFLPNLELARIIALVRFIKIGRYTKGIRTLGFVFHERKDEIIAAFILLAILTISASIAMFEVEHSAQPDVFTSPFSGLYWAMTTITTTGYGDMVPITAAGKLIGFATMVLSIGVVAVPAGIFSAGFVDTYKKFKTLKSNHDTTHTPSKD